MGAKLFGFIQVDFMYLDKIHLDKILDNICFKNANLIQVEFIQVDNIYLDKYRNLSSRTPLMGMR